MFFGVNMSKYEKYINNADQIYNISDESMIHDSLNYILKNYLEYIEYIRNKNDELPEKENLTVDEYPDEYKNLYYFIRNVFPNFLKEKIEYSSDLYMSGNENHFGNPPFVPWISINFNKKNTTGYYLTYLFKSDMTGVYLCLMLAAQQYSSNGRNIGVDKDNFNKLLAFFYENCEDELNFVLENFSDNISLKCKEQWKNSDCGRPTDYEYGTIFCKYYSTNKLPEENILKNNLYESLELYEFAKKYDIFNKIFDENYSFDLEKEAFYQNRILKDLFDADGENIESFKNNLINLEQNFNGFSKLLVSHRWTDGYLKHFYFDKENRTIKLYLMNKRVSNNYNDGFNIYVDINLNKFFLEFGLITNFQRLSSENCINHVFEFLKDYFKNDDFEFNVSDNKIIFKTIPISNLNQITLLNTYKTIINVYERVIPYYICLLFNQYILNNNFYPEKLENKNTALQLTKESVSEELSKNKIILDDEIIYEVCASLNAEKNIILNGAPGTGKTQLAKIVSDVAEKNFVNGYIITTATSDWSTFDTIGGLMPSKESNNLIFKEGKFLQAIRENKWLIIDEINRADIDKAFGQLFTILSGNDVIVELSYEDENNKPIKIKKWDEYYSNYDESNATYNIGKNWRIIGTMNYDDKDTLFDLSYAFMRRFKFIDVKCPSDIEFEKMMNSWYSDLKNDKMFEYKKNLMEIYNIEFEQKELGPALFKDMLEYINKRIEFSDEKDLILNESISSYIIPQLEGLNEPDLADMKVKLNGIVPLNKDVEKKIDKLSLN